MVLIIFVGGIFLGFALGFATMALLAARGDRVQFEKAVETSGCYPRQRVGRVFPVFQESPGMGQGQENRLGGRVIAAGANEKIGARRFFAPGYV